MNASELEGKALDIEVARAEGWEFLSLGFRDPSYGTWHGFARAWSSDWAHGGPIVERERLTICAPHDDAPPDRFWQACTHQGHFMAWGPTPLIAAMRAYVASKGKL